MSLILDDSLKNYPYYSDLLEQIQKRNHFIDPEVNMILTYENEVLSLDSSQTPRVYCDFLNEAFLKEVRQNFGRSEGVYSFLRPLSKGRALKICDLTVGLGRDFFKFVLAGHQVVGFERNPIFYHIVKDGMERFFKSSRCESLKALFKVEDFSADLIFGDSLETNTKDYNLVYYDPMFEDLSKKAAPKKGMQALKLLSAPSGEDEKEQTLRSWIGCVDHFVYKTSAKNQISNLTVKRKISGKGFAYLIL